jgi:hypothetical protein
MGLIRDATMNTGPHQRVVGNLKCTAEATEQFVQQEQLAVQQQLYVLDQIRSLIQQQLVVNQEQLVQAMKTVQHLGITKQRLAGIDASLAAISGLLVQQNALIQKSLHRLAIEAQELLGRTDQERAVRDQHPQQLVEEIAGTVPPPTQPPCQPIIGGEIGEPGSREEPKDTGGPSREHPDPFFASLARGEEIPSAEPIEPEGKDQYEGDERRRAGLRSWAGLDPAAETAPDWPAPADG